MLHPSAPPLIPFVLTMRSMGTHAESCWADPETGFVPLQRFGPGTDQCIEHWKSSVSPSVPFRNGQGSCPRAADGRHGSWRISTWPVSSNPRAPGTRDPRVSRRLGFRAWHGPDWKTMFRQKDPEVFKFHVDLFQSVGDM